LFELSKDTQGQRIYISKGTLPGEINFIKLEGPRPSGGEKRYKSPQIGTKTGGK